MHQNTPLTVFLFAIAAFAPVAVWLSLIFKKGEQSKKTVILIFLAGCLTAPALLGMQYLWHIFPEFDLGKMIENSIQSQSKEYIAMFILFAALEEIFKMYVIISIDKKTVLIRTVGDAIKYSVTSALAFSFTENIYYLTSYWTTSTNNTILGMYISRSVITMCAHMVFSGIFGYYYGISKFAMYIKNEEERTRKKHRIAKIISKVFRLPTSQGYQQELILKGLTIAILSHATFNFLLQYNHTIPPTLFIIIGFLYVKYLLKRKAGHLLLDIDISNKSKSTMVKKDEDIVIDLLGLWFKEKKYADVIHVCERLLERDPDNIVVKLFKAKALDQIDTNDTYRNILETVIKTNDELDSKQRNILTKHIEEKEMFRRVQEMIRKELRKKGKKLKTKETKQKKQIEKKKDGNILSKYTGKGKFNINL